MPISWKDAGGYAEPVAIFEKHNGVYVAVSGGDFTQQHRFTATQNWNWPYPSRDRAVVILHGRTEANGPPVRAASKDVGVGDFAYSALVAGDDELWVVSSSVARAYGLDDSGAVPARDIALPSIGFWRGATRIDDIIWFGLDTTGYYRAYNVHDLTRQSSRDSDNTFGQGTDGLVASPSQGLLWVMRSDSDSLTAYDPVNGAAVPSRNIDLGMGGKWEGGAGHDTRLWIADDNSNNARAYDAVTGSRDASSDIVLEAGTWRGGAVYEDTLLFLDIDSNHVRAYDLEGGSNVTSLIVGGSTYTTLGDDDGIVIVTLDNIANDQIFDITVGPDGMVDIYPQ